MSMKNFFFSALCAFALIGCTQEPATPTIDKEDVGGETGYLAFRVKNANTGGMTRAWLDDDTTPGDYQEGETATGNFAGEDEIVNNIQANRVFFFYSDGTYHSSSLLALEASEDSSHVGDEDHKESYIEFTYSATVKRTSERGKDDWPEQCLVILNGRPSRLNALLLRVQADETFKMEHFLAWVNEDFRDGDVEGEGETLGLYKYQDKYYFTMSNSIFLQKDGEPLNATQIDLENDLYKTSAEAKEHPITVYVERIISKVEVNFANYDEGPENPYFHDGMTKKFFTYKFTSEHDAAGKWLDGGEQDDEKAVTINLQALVTNWTINAVEYKTKLFKNLDTDSWKDTGNEQTDVPFYGWNDYIHHRSYWGIDPHYDWDAALYPTQYRTSYVGDATSYQDETEKGWGYGNGTKEDYEGKTNDILNPAYPWALDYKSYNAITSYRKHKYCLENTFGLKGNEGADEGYKHMIMGSHLLVQARLVTDDEVAKLTTGDKADLDANVKDKYYYSDRYYDEATYICRQVGIINDLLGDEVLEDFTMKAVTMYPEDTNKGEIQLGKQEGGLWVKTGDKWQRVAARMQKKDSDDNDLKDWEIAATDVFGIAPAYIAKGDGKVTIALLGDDENGFAYGVDELVNLYYLNEYKPTDELNGQPVLDDEHFMTQFHRNEVISLIYHMTNVADCFKMGCMYYAIPIQHYIAAGEDKNYEAKYTNINTGDYGIVRNHWYKFTINAIAKPGIPVHDPDQPIIPNYDEEDRYIGLQVVIIPWHVVNNGGITLGN